MSDDLDLSANIAKLYPNSPPPTDGTEADAEVVDEQPQPQRQPKPTTQRQEPEELPEQDADLDDGEADGVDDEEHDDDDSRPSLNLRAPKDHEVDSRTLAEFGKVARELQLTEKEGQRVVDRMVPLMQQRMQQQIEAQVQQWVVQSKADKEMNGGAGFRANLDAARSVIQTHGDPALNQLLDETGLGNHPAMLRFVHRIARAGKVAPAQQTPQQQQREQLARELTDAEMARRLYGKAPPRRGVAQSRTISGDADARKLYPNS